MLVLSRHIANSTNNQESIKIGRKDEVTILHGEITIWVVGAHGDKVRLGIEAPKDVPVNRNEIFDKINGTSGSTVT